MEFPALLNFQFSIFNFQSKFNFQIVNIENSFQISSFKLKIFLLFSIFYLLSSLFLTVQPLHAQQTTTNPYTAPNTDPDVPKNLSTLTQTVTIEIIGALSCQLSGINPANPNQACLGVDPQTGKIGFVQADEGGGGAIGVMGKMISVLYTPPLHTGDYFGNLAQNFGIVKKAYAQGTGFEGLKPLLSLWTAFRNIVYLIFTIVFVVIGLAIMFRVKIDPRTVMTIQNQIPKIIVGIVLVTFSYAIAGFLIDMMYTSIYLTGNILTSASGQPASVVTGVIESDNPFSAAGQIRRDGGNTALGIAQFAWEPAKTVGGAIGAVFDNVPGRIITSIAMSVIGKVIAKPASDIVESIFFTAGGILGTFFGPGIGTAVGVTAGTALANIVKAALPAAAGAGGAIFGPEILSAFTGLIAFVVVAIAIIWSLFRLWFILILSYIYILIAVVLAPFWIAGGLIPGSPINFTGWLRHIVSYLAVFPLTIALFLLGKVFINIFGTNAKGFVPPMISNPSDTNAIGAIIGLGIILLTPNVLRMTQAALKAPKVEVGTPMQAIGVGAGLGGIPGRMGQIGLMLGGMQNIPGIRKIPGLSRLIGSREGGGGQQQQ